MLPEPGAARNLLAPDPGARRAAVQVAQVHHPPQQRRIRQRQPVVIRADVILKSRTGIAVYSHGPPFILRDLMPPYPGVAPVGIGGQPCISAHGLGLMEMGQIKALNFRLHATGPHLARQPIHKIRRIPLPTVRDVVQPDRQAGHVRAQRRHRPARLPVPGRPPVETSKIRPGQCYSSPSCSRAKRPGWDDGTPSSPRALAWTVDASASNAACVDSICSATVIGAGLFAFFGRPRMMATQMMQGLVKISPWRGLASGPARR